MKIIDVVAFFILLFLALPINLYAQKVPDEIYKALKTGNSKELASHFNSNIYLVILGAEGVYTKTQSTLILRDFFSKYIPHNYIKMNELGKGTSKCVIGRLLTSKGNYRVVFIHKEAGPEFIDQFRIEEEN